MKEQKLTVDVGNNKIFFYQGNILEDDGTFITFKDRFLGVIKFNKKTVLKMEGGK